MDFAIHNTSIGLLKLSYKDDTVYKIEKLFDKPDDFGTKTAFTDFVFDEIAQYLNGDIKKFTFRFELVGTDFQRSVWQALLDIPYGETRSYKDIAKAIGNEKASRAVGMANNKNPIIIAVPCHRVIGANGSLVGYAGGLSMKKSLLETEQNNT